MREAEEVTGETQARYDALLARHLAFYDSLRTRERRPRTAAQRQFQDVAWGKAEAVTEHEKAYVHHLRQRGIGAFAATQAPPHIDDVMAGHDPGIRPVGGDVGRKWDEAWREYRDGREFW